MRESLLRLVGDYGLPIVALAILLESAGVPIPGETALLVAAAAAGAGRLSITAVIALAAAAAIVGDAGGYWLGRRGGRPFLERHGRWLHLDQATLDRLEAFFARYGPRAVFFGRFVGVLRTYAALFAGISRMPYGTFTLFNAAGGIVWAGLFGMVGYLFGQRLATVERFAGALGGGLLIGVGLVGGGALLWRWAVRHQALLVDRAQVLMASPPIARARRRYRRELAWLLARVTPGQYLGLHLTLGVLAAVGGLWLFGGILQDILAQEPLVRFDETVAKTLQAWATPLATTVFRGITRLGSIGVGVLTLGVLARYGGRLLPIQVGVWILAVGVGEGLTYVLKALLARRRPGMPLPLAAAGGYSFPSGHAMVALIAYGMAAYYVILELRSWRARTGVACAAIVLVLLVGFSRLYLGVHYFSDVVGGYAAGSVWLSACITGAELIRRGEVGEWWRKRWHRLP